MEKVLRCEIYSPEGSVYKGDATQVVATAVDGQLGVLYNHAPLVTALGEGPLRITAPDGSERRYVAMGGFLEVFQNHVTVLTEKIEAAE